METRTLVLIVVLILAVAAVVIAFLLTRYQNTRKLKSRFGPEYDRLREQEPSVRRTEAELEERQERVSKYPIRILRPEERQRFSEDWRLIQERFVDTPRAAVTLADELVNEVMRARGFPVADFERQAADLSVEHPE